jgi:hypothetical protein
MTIRADFPSLLRRRLFLDRPGRLAIAGSGAPIYCAQLALNSITPAPMNNKERAANSGGPFV